MAEVLAENGACMIMADINGDVVETLYDIETEKVTMEVEAPCDGIMIEPKVAEGDSAEVGQVVCTIDQA